MFPRGLLIFILILVFDIISKSIKDKKKIEESRRKRQENLNRDTVMKESSFEEIKEFEEPFYEEKLEEYTVEAKNVETGSFSNDEYKDSIEDYTNKEQIVDMTKIYTESKEKSKKEKKNDILKGIIFSEVLSEPKSIKNMKRSM